MLSVAVAALLLAAPPPPAARAVELQKRKAWDDLYLAYSAVSGEGYTEADRAKIEKALVAGCRALASQDAVIAYSLADTATRFGTSSDGLLCLARTAGAAEQRSAAEAALRTGLSQYPERYVFPLELGRLLLDEGDAAGSVELLERIPAKAKERAQAVPLLRKARLALAAERSAHQQAAAIERRLERGETVTSGGNSGPSLTYASSEGPGGMRQRANSRFTIKYFNNQRDFGQRAEYEGQVVAALDEAYAAAQRILGVSRSRPVDVVLYTQAEFAAHFNAQVARRVAGLYHLDSIRINDAAELNRQNRATLVHEYVHAVLDDLMKGATLRLPLWVNEGIAEYVEWRYLGRDEPEAQVSAQLRAAARGGYLPTLQQMDRSAPINSRVPHLAYAKSATAVRMLLSSGGTPRLLDLVRDVGGGMPFEDALAQHYGRSLEQLEGDVSSELGGR